MLLADLFYFFPSKHQPSCTWHQITDICSTFQLWSTSDDKFIPTVCGGSCQTIYLQLKEEMKT